VVERAGARGKGSKRRVSRFETIKMFLRYPTDETEKDVFFVGAGRLYRKTQRRKIKEKGNRGGGGSHNKETLRYERHNPNNTGRCNFGGDLTFRRI